MRRTVIIVVLVLAAANSFAQVQAKGVSPEHLKFMGVPIDGSLSAFVQKMETNGFTREYSETGYALMVGEYASRKKTRLDIETMKGEDVVSKVAVMFPPGDTWSSVSADYFSLKKMLTETYGVPADQAERFRGGSPADDGARMDKVKSGLADYYSTYETPHGSIQLTIDHDKTLGCFAQLAFYDKVNGEEM